LKVSINDPLLEQFQLTSPSLTALMEDVGGFLAAIRKKDQPLPENFRDELKNVIKRAEGEMALLDQDLETLQKSMPERRAGLKNLEVRLAERIKEERVDPHIYDVNFFEERVTELRTKDIPKNLSRLRALFVLLDVIAQSDEPTLREMIRNHSFDAATMEALDELNDLLKLEDSGASVADADRLVQQRDLEVMTEQLKTLREQAGVESSSKPPRETKRIIADLRQKDEYRDWIRGVVAVLQYELMSLSLMQTRARLDAMTLAPVSVDTDEAFRIASENRLDWMNRKAQLVDTWRQIDIVADKLKGVFDLKLNGSLGTADNRGVHFGKETGSLDVRFEWDTPLTRYNEMMDYRKSQIDYQKARRDYYTYVDSVQSELRNVLRDVQMSQINFEINRNAILVGTIRVDLMQLQMEQPPQRGAKIDTNTSQQLINALNGLMNSQNDFLNTWVTYQTQRMLLDLYMGTMTLDDKGRWIEPSGKDSKKSEITSQPELVPTLAVPIIKTSRLNRRYVE
jgi:hypothetical protein